MGDPNAVVGIVPAAGFGTRLSEGADGNEARTAPASKEARPLGQYTDRAGVMRPRPMASHVLERLGAGGIKRAHVVLRREKQDVRATLGDGGAWGVELRYVETPATPSVPHTLLVALETLADRTIALAFPDILFQPVDAFRALAARHREARADLTLGLFPASQPEKTDMVQLDAEDRVIDLVIKQADCPWRYTWSIAMWSPRFSAFLHEQVVAVDAQAGPSGQELWMGEVVRAALASSLQVECEIFEQGRYLDVGTPADFAQAAREIEAE